jgi:hypothetical protein
LLVVDLPNGSDFPKPVGNTAIIHYHTLLLPIHDLKKKGGGAGLVIFILQDGFSLCLPF